MIDVIKRKEDFKKIIKGLDISPTMFKNATTKYENIANYLNECGLNVDIYPQGSFSLGTVVRPYKDDKEQDYDLDFICLINKEKNMTTPKEVKNDIGDALKANGKYKLQSEWDKCWTVEYAEINDIGFNIDIVPAVQEDSHTIEKLQSLSQDNSKINLSIAITHKTDEGYKWCTNNPKGYKEWFDEINEPFKQFNREKRKQELLESYRTIFASVEEIPEEIERSSLQRVIQVLKRHRDIYFSKIKKDNKKDNNKELRPISAIITVISAQIAKSAPKSLDVWELLEYVVKEFEIYSERQILTEQAFDSKYTNKKIIERKNGIWKIENPVNPQDNLADSWNSNPNKAEYFFKWVKQIKEDFIESFSKEDSKFVCILESSLGTNFVNKSIDTKIYCNEPVQVINNMPKPWRK